VWKSIGWEEALRLCAEKIQGYRSEPECILHNYGEGDKGVLSQAGSLSLGLLFINPDEIAWSDH